MKLTDQIFAVLAPAEWHTAIELPFPPAWHAIASRLASSDIEEIVWQCNHIILAEYISSRIAGRLMLYDHEGSPNQLSITCGAHIDVATLLSPVQDKSRVRHCGCCATLSYNP